MKLIPIVSVLAASASADLLSLVKTLEAQANNSTQNGPQFRNFDNIWDGLGGIFASMTQQITTSGDYGCWCYFASNNGYVGSGFGQPVDNYDRACKTLHDNYACMALDDSTCDPYTVAYNVPANWIALIPSTDDLAGPCFRDANELHSLRLPLTGRHHNVNAIYFIHLEFELVDLLVGGLDGGDIVATAASGLRALLQQCQ